MNWLRRLLCACGWHTWIEVIYGHRVCPYCGRREVLRFVGAGHAVWDEDTEHYE